MLSAKVVGGQYVNAMISVNRKGELSLSSGGFKRLPNLSSETVATWEEVFPEARGAAIAVRNIGEAVTRAGLPGPLGRAAAAAVTSTVDAVKSAGHTVRIDWVDGHQSVIQLTEKLFQHLEIVLRDCRVASAPPAPEPAATADTSATSGVMGQIAQLAGVVAGGQTDVADQILKLAALRDQGVLTEAEFAAKKTELLGRI